MPGTEVKIPEEMTGPDPSDGDAAGPDAARGLATDLTTGLRIGVCATVAEVQTCWRLVYRSYLSAGLIKPNRTGMHTHRWACSANAAVFAGRIGDLTVSTISAYMDDPEHGLPLDAVYHDEMDELRRQGRRMVEIGLFADRREHLYRSIGVLLELMRWATWFGVTHGATDGIIGVHPHHAKFYTKLLGFDIVGEEKPYDVVAGNPVVLLRLDWPSKTQLDRLPRGLQQFVDQPIDRDAFADRPTLTLSSSPDAIPLASSAKSRFVA